VKEKLAYPLWIATGLEDGDGEVIVRKNTAPGKQCKAAVIASWHSMDAAGGRHAPWLSPDLPLSRVLPREAVADGQLNDSRGRSTVYAALDCVAWNDGQSARSFGRLCF
jgi:hypothetical protein